MNPFAAFFGKADFDTLSASDFADKFKEEKNALLIDVRTKGEHEEYRIPNSRLIDVSSINFKKEIEKLDKSKTLFVYCASGARSRAACNIMKKAGFETVYNLSGGICSWKGKIEH